MLLPTCQWYFPCRCGKRGIQIMQIFLCQMNGKASEIIFHMGYITGFGYGNDTGLTHRPRQCDLCRRYIVSPGDFHQCMVVQKSSFSDGRISHKRHSTGRTLCPGRRGYRVPDRWRSRFHRTVKQYVPCRLCPYY